MNLTIINCTSVEWNDAVKANLVDAIQSEMGQAFPSPRFVSLNESAIDAEVSEGLDETDARIKQTSLAAYEIQENPNVLCFAFVPFDTRLITRLLDSLVVPIPCVTIAPNGTIRVLRSRACLRDLDRVKVQRMGLLNLYECLLRDEPKCVELGLSIPSRRAANGQPVSNCTVLFDGTPVGVVEEIPSNRVRRLIRAWNEDGPRGATELMYPHEAGMPPEAALTRLFQIVTSAIKQTIRDKHVVEKGVRKTRQIRVPHIETEGFAEFQFGSARDIMYRVGRSGQWKPFGRVSRQAFEVIRPLLLAYAKRTSVRNARNDVETDNDTMLDEFDSITLELQEMQSSRLSLQDQMRQLNQRINDAQSRLDELDGCGDE